MTEDHGLHAELSSQTGDDRRLRGRPNDPVVLVNWREARRFCDFLTQAWRRVLPKGFVVTLPSEAEWEKAARGGGRITVEYEPVTPPRLQATLETASVQMPNPLPTRAYPWGESFAADQVNVEATIGETSAVDCYPTGASPFGCEDLRGHIKTNRLIYQNSVGYALRTPRRRASRYRPGVAGERRT